jgi:hypothetical protein
VSQNPGSQLISTSIASHYGDGSTRINTASAQPVSDAYLKGRRTKDISESDLQKKFPDWHIGWENVSIWLEGKEYSKEDGVVLQAQDLRLLQAFIRAPNRCLESNDICEVCERSGNSRREAKHYVSELNGKLAYLLRKVIEGNPIPRTKKNSGMYYFRPKLKK